MIDWIIHREVVALLNSRRKLCCRFLSKVVGSRIATSTVAKYSEGLFRNGLLTLALMEALSVKYSDCERGFKICVAADLSSATSRSNRCSIFCAVCSIRAYQRIITIIGEALCFSAGESSEQGIKLVACQVVYLDKEHYSRIAGIMASKITLITFWCYRGLFASIALLQMIYPWANYYIGDSKRFSRGKSY